MKTKYSKICSFCAGLNKIKTPEWSDKWKWDNCKWCGTLAFVVDVPSPLKSVHTFSRIGFSFQRFPTALKKVAKELNLTVVYKINNLSLIGEREYVFTLSGEKLHIDKCIKILDEQFDVVK